MHKHVAYQCEICDYYVHSSDYADMPVIYCGKCSSALCLKCMADGYKAICKNCAGKWKRKEKIELVVNCDEGEEIYRLCQQGYLSMGELTEIKDKSKPLSEVNADDVEIYAILIHQGEF